MNWDINEEPSYEIETLDFTSGTSNYVGLDICSKLTNLDRHWKLTPAQEALLSANLGLEFEGFCDYSKGIYRAEMVLISYKNEQDIEYQYIQNDTYTSTNDDFPDFDATQWAALSSGPLFEYGDGQVKMRVANTFYNIPMPLGLYFCNLRLFSFGDSTWNYEIEMVT